MLKKYRVAVIGAGAIGHDHIQGFQQSPYAKVVAIAEKNASRGEETAKKFGVSDLYKDYRRILYRKDIDVVSIALPNYLHAPVAIATLKAGKHVLVDKPMATNAQDAARIITAAKRARKIFMVGQNFRFSPEAQLLKTTIEAGALGKIYHARAYWLRQRGIPRIGSWFTQKKFAGGGACYDIGVHLIDLALHLMGDFKIQSVVGRTTGYLGSRGIGDGTWGKSEIDSRKIFDVDDCARAFLKLKSGATLYLEVTWAALSEVNDTRGIDLFGDRAGAHWKSAKIFRPSKGKVVTKQLNPTKLRYPTERMVHFMECVALGKKPLVKPEQSLQVQKVLDAIYQSSRTGREIRFKA